MSRQRRLHPGRLHPSKKVELGRHGQTNAEASLCRTRALELYKILCTAHLSMVLQSTP